MYKGTYRTPTVLGPHFIIWKNPGASNTSGSKHFTHASECMCGWGRSHEKLAQPKASEYTAPKKPSEAEVLWQLAPQGTAPLKPWFCWTPACTMPCTHEPCPQGRARIWDCDIMNCTVFIENAVSALSLIMGDVFPVTFLSMQVSNQCIFELYCVKTSTFLRTGLCFPLSNKRCAAALETSQPQHCCLGNSERPNGKSREKDPCAESNKQTWWRTP